MPEVSLRHIIWFWLASKCARVAWAVAGIRPHTGASSRCRGAGSALSRAGICSYICVGAPGGYREGILRCCNYCCLWRAIITGI